MQLWSAGPRNGHALLLYALSSHAADVAASVMKQKPLLDTPREMRFADSLAGV